MAMKRLSKEERRSQLLGVALDIVREEGVDAMTLARVAERAGVSKPIAYDHFGTRDGLLTALYLDHDRRQTAVMRQALGSGGGGMEQIVDILASAVVDCAVDAGPEIRAVAAALEGSPGKEEVLQACRDGFIDECRRALQPFGGFQGAAGDAALAAIVGAAEALSRAAAARHVDRASAIAMLRMVIQAAAEAQV